MYVGDLYGLVVLHIGLIPFVIQLKKVGISRCLVRSKSMMNISCGAARARYD